MAHHHETERSLCSVFLFTIGTEGSLGSDKKASHRGPASKYEAKNERKLCHTLAIVQRNRIAAPE